MDGLLAASPGQDLILLPAIDEEEIVIPHDGGLMHLGGLALPVELVLELVRQNPGEYLTPRHAPCEELPDHWEVFSGNNYLGLQQHLQEELDAAEQVEDMDNDEEDFDDRDETMDCTKTASQDVDALSSASQHVTKRDDTITDDCRLLKDIRSSSSSVATIGLQDSAMPDASPAVFVPILESVSRISNNR